MILPNWRNFPKSGHTDRLDYIESRLFKCKRDSIINCFFSSKNLTNLFIYLFIIAMACEFLNEMPNARGKIYDMNKD